MSRQSGIVAVALMLGHGLACSAMSAKDMAADSGSAVSGSTSPASDSSDDVPPADPATYYSLRGTVEVLDGSVVVDGAVVDLDYWDDSLLCTVSPTLLDVTSEIPPRDQPIAAWWQVTLDGDEDHADCAYVYPETFFLGLGAVDPAMLPTLDVQAVDPVTVYGAYIQDREDDVWVFGYAGTDQNLEGEIVSDTSVLADGTYHVESLYLLPAL